MIVPWYSAFFFAFGVGLLAFCLPVPIREVGRGFYRMMAGWALFFAVCAAMTRPLDASTASVTGYVFLGAAAFVNGLLWAGAERAAAWSSLLAVLAGLAGLLTSVRYPSRGLPAEPWIAGASLAASAAMLGAVLDTMVLGHWYLVKKGMSFDLLRRMNALFGASVALRAVVLCAEALWLTQVFRAATQDQLIFFLRLAVGVVGPAALAWMTWRCIRIKSNQSATGILYVACVFVLIGEMVATWSLRAL
ncbi:MAG: hypothetical protein FD180_1310 [Planctomycetota bacterium]|nr:MAG: hypothetical protein FD180_1310 [Planctomycetota bacterium]